MKIKTMLLAASCFSTMFAMDDMQTIDKPQPHLNQPLCLRGNVEMNRQVVNCLVIYDAKAGTYGGHYTSTPDGSGSATQLNHALAASVYRVLLADLQSSKK